MLAKLFSLIVFVSVLTACGTGAAPQLPTVAPTVAQPTPVPATPVSDQPTMTTPPQLTIPAEYAPLPEDAQMIQGGINLESSQLLIRESYPAQVSLELTGSYPSPCHALRIKASPPDAQHQIQIEIYTVADPKRACADLEKPLKVVIPLGNFASGPYTVLVNGQTAGVVNP